MTRRRRLVVIAGVVLAAALLFAFRQPLARGALDLTLDIALGSKVQLGEVHLGASHADLRGVHVGRGGLSFFDADRIALDYDLRDLLPGSAHRFGLRYVELYRPVLTIRRLRDGSLNFGGGPSTGGGRQVTQSKGAETPLALRALVHDGAVIVLDQYRFHANARMQRIEAIGAEATIDSATLTRYWARGAYRAAGKAYPLSAAGTIDTARAFAVHRLRAATVPLPAIVDYFIDSGVATLTAGTARDIDVRFYALGAGARYHLTGAATVVGGALALSSLEHPLRDLQGRLDAFDDGIAAPELRATLAGVGVRLAGGLLAFARPTFRVGMTTDGPLRALRTAFAFSAVQPVAGEARVDALLEGPAADPLILAGFSAPSVAFNALPIEGVRGTIAFYHQASSVVPFVARYGGIDIRAYGSVETAGAQAISTFAVDASAPASAVPYAAQTVPNARLLASGLLAGTNGDFAARGVIAGSGGGDRLQALFSVDPHGNGVFGPVLASRADGGSAAGAFYLNRSSSLSAFWLDARRFAVTQPARPPVLPGLPQLVPPAFASVLDGSVGGEGPPSAFALAGHLGLHDLSLGPVRIAEATGQILGSPADLRVESVHATGPWGAFAGAGAYDGDQLLLRGDYRGSFGQLEVFTGRLGAAGRLAVPVSLLIGPKGTVVQSAGARTPDARVQGVPLDAVSGTLAADGQGVRVLAASAGVAGGGLTATGSLSRGVSVTLARADARRLRAAGLPLSSGSVSAVGVAGTSGSALRFDGGALVERARFGRIPLAGNGDLHVRGSDVGLDRVDGAAYATWGSAKGRVAGLGSPRLRYDLGVRLRAADVAEVAAAAGIAAVAQYHVDGSADADLHVGGSGAHPLVSGDVHLPESTVNGLFVAAGSGHIRAEPAALSIDSGRAVVGSTIAGFGGRLRRRDAEFAFDAKHAVLSDFDNYFDEGDMLAGSGHVTFAVTRLNGGVHTSGDVGLQGLRISHFPFGDASARWASAGSRISGNAGFAGPLGAVDAVGSVSVPARSRLRSLLGRSTFDVRARASGVDLGAVLPALGYDLPIAGHVDADGTVRGRFPALALSGDATLVGGTYGKLPIDRLTVAATSSFSRATITSADLEVGSISVRGSGSFGFRPRDPLSLAVHASGADLGTVVAKLTGNRLPLRGAFEADVHAAGPRTKPAVTGGFDVENGSLQGVAVPRVLGEFSVVGRDVELRDAEVAFSTGTLYLAGSIPLTVAPFGFGPAAAPITLELAAKGINLSDFTPVLPHGSVAKGEIAGRVAVAGTVAAPRLTGELALTGGEFAAPVFETVPLRDVRGRVTFSGTSALLQDVHAGAGGGSIDVTGSAALPDLVNPGLDGTYDLRAAFAHARLDLPAYGKGQIDGALSFHHVPHNLAVLAGSVALQDAVIPFSALYNPSAGGGEDPFAIGSTSTTPGGLPNVAFALDVAAGRSVRVRSSVLDIGGTGALHIGGTLADPRLSGIFNSTGGTLTYFNRVFRLVDGTVTFQPDLGIIPILDARATAHVINPDPNPQRNLTGSADITLNVRGPVTNLNIGLESDPQYDRQQILGLLLSVPAVGGTSLFDNPTAPGTQPTTSGSQTIGGNTVAQEAFGVLNAQFTRNLLAPLESAFGSALGLTSLNVTFDYTGNVGFSARKILGKSVNVVYATTFGYPYRQTFGFEIRPSPATAAQLTFYQTIGNVGTGFQAAPITGAVNRVTVAQPITGSSGFSFTLQRFFP